MKLSIGNLNITISWSGKKSTDDLPAEVIDALKTLEKYGYKKVTSFKQLQSAKKAARTKAERAKQKVITAYNELKTELGKTPTMYAVQKRTGLSYNTVKKYFPRPESI